jgi:RNA polymerase sigma factor (sigma-70 family)
MTTNKITALCEPSDENAYLAELEEILRRMIGKRTQLRLHDAEDFLQYFLCWAWGRPDLTERYVPAALASASFANRLTDWHRQQGRQLPQGEYDPKTGKVVNAVWSLDHVLFTDDEGDDLTFGDTLTGDDDWLERIKDNDLISRTLGVLTPAQQQIFVLVEGLQYKVVEVAKMLGYKREWTQRELGKARVAMSVFTQEWN